VLGWSERVIKMYSNQYEVMTTVSFYDILRFSRRLLADLAQPSAMLGRLNGQGLE
jgi:hypothetical protein